jgi:uncharacterized protein (UPF0335 family)
MTNTGTFAADQLKSIVSRIENIQAEIEERKNDEKEIYSEAKSNGLDCKIIREIIRLRKKDPNELSEHEQLVQLYLEALGPLPLFEHAAE